MNGNLKLILGVLWRVVLRFHIHDRRISSRNKIRTILLSWFRSVLPHSNINNFSTDWNDGINLSALVDYCKPGLIPNHASLDPNNGLQNITNAMNLAEENFGIPQVMRPEDLAVPKPDELSVMVYVSYFCRPDSVGQKRLIEWLNTVLPGRNITNFSTDWKDGRNLCALVNAVAPGSLPPQSMLDAQSARENIQLAIEAAERHYPGILLRMSAGDFLSPLTHPLSIVTYLSTFQFLDQQSVQSPWVAAVGPSFSSAATGKGVLLESGINGGATGKDAMFSVQGDLSFEDDLTLAIASLEGDQIDFEQLISPPQTPSSPYPPTIPGTYTVDVRQQVSGSPDQMTHREQTNVGHCRVSGRGITRASVGMVAEFLIDCSVAGRASISVEVIPPSGENIPTTITLKPTGVHQVRFVPETIGEHTINVYWAGKPVPNSPYNCLVANPSVCTASGSGLSTAYLGRAARFQVTTEGAGPGSLSATVYGPSEPVELSLLSNDRGVYVYEYTPQQTGTYFIDIKWNGFQVRGSPFTIRPQKATVASKCYIQKLPVGRVQVGKVVSLTVNTKAAGVTDGPGLTASVRGPSVYPCCEIAQPEEGVYEVTFYPQVMGEYTVNVIYSGSPIPDSPCSFTANDPSKCEVLNAEEVSSGVHHIGKPVTFQVSTDQAGEGELTATVRGPEKDFTPKVTDKGDGSFVVSFTPQEPGRHTFDVWFDGVSFLYSPIIFNVESNVQNILLTKPVSHLGYHQADTLLEMSIFAPNRQARGFAVSALGMQTGAIPSTEIVPMGNDSFHVRFRAPYSDDYRVEITYDKQHLPGSPFNLTIRAPPCADKVMTFDPIVPLKVGKPIELMFDTSQAGVGTLTTNVATASNKWVAANIEEISSNLYSVSFTPEQNTTFTIDVFWSDRPVDGSPFTITFEEQLKEPFVSVMFEPQLGIRGMLSASVFGQNIGEVETSVQQFERGQYQIGFSPPRKDIYNLHLFWFDQEVRGSPFTMDLMSPKLHRKQQHTSVATLPIELPETKGELSACVVGQRTGEVPINLSLTENQDAVRIVFRDRVRDSYDLFVYWNDSLLKGAPFKLEPPKPTARLI